MDLPDLSWATKSDNDRLIINVNLHIYPLEIIFRACYLFTDRCYLFLSEAAESIINVHFAQSKDTCDLSKIIGEFCNELINQKLIATIAKETQTVRNLIVAQAFAEADLIEPQEPHNLKDPRETQK